MPANKKTKKKKNDKPKRGRWFKVKPLDPTKLFLGIFSTAALLGVTVITDMRTDCREAEQQIVQEQRENPGAEIRYVGVGGVVCSIADPGGGSSGGWGP